MVLIPANLSQWNFEVIKDLVDKGYLEADEFEFKPAIKNRDPNLQTRIVETACGFANTDGGFIIFGVKDMGNKTDDRITGIDKSDDLATQFGDKLKHWGL